MGSFRHTPVQPKVKDSLNAQTKEREIALCTSKYKKKIYTKERIRNNEVMLSITRIGYVICECVGLCFSESPLREITRI